MITYIKGNILDSRAQTLTCPVNCVGVMGKGLALEFKKAFPGLLSDYSIACTMQYLKIGHPWVWKVTEAKQVLCFPTKDHWKKPSTYEYITKGLQALREHRAEWQIFSLALPPLGCGLGGLEWAKVKPMIEESLGDLDLPVEVYEP
jgi:O-acetyl-ADP-ribose deacetylase (regulator of RNase III)